jgi:8-oxo-dGTP pyrophosphatase MutT (NUDIX family)
MTEGPARAALRHRDHVHEDGYNIVMGTKQQRSSRAIVAAVCHRRVVDTVELLLVRTTKGKRWTFPKGHVGPGERPAEAAAREALEEAGVEGDVAATPFTHYRYPGTRADEDESVVAAYLLAVTEQRAPASGERHRNPTWVTPDRATRLLAEGDREPEYAAEHARVVRDAVAALTS